MKLVEPPFQQWVDMTYPGIIRWESPSDAGQTNRRAYNRNVPGVEDSMIFPGQDVIVNGNFAADTDWLHPDAAITIAGGQATWSGAQVGNADLTATVAPLTSGDRYGRFIVLSGVTAGTLTPLFGTQVGVSMNANGTYQIDEQVANGTAFLLRGDSSFAGSCELVRIPTANPLNVSIIGATVAQPFGGNLPWANLYDNINDYGVIAAAALNAAFDPTECTVIVFAQVSGPGVWTDGQYHNIVELLSDGNNKTELYININNNELQNRQVAAGVSKGIIVSTSTVSRFMLAITVSKSAGASGEVKVFFNGEQQGATQTGLGVYAGALDPNGVNIGSFNGPPSGTMDGLISDVLLHPTRAMAPGEIAEIDYRWDG